MLTFDDPSFANSADPHTTTLVELLGSSVYDQGSVIASLQAAGLSPGDYVLNKARLTWVEAVPDAARRGTLPALIAHVGSWQPAFKTELTRRLEALSVPTGERRWYASADPYASAFVGLRGARAVIDRAALRSAVRDLVNDDYWVLVVHGEPRSGKSHTWLFIEHLRRTGHLLGSTRLTRVSTHDWSDEAEVTGNAVAQVLGRRLGLSVLSAPSGELDDAAVRKFLDLLLGVYPDDGTTRWIVLDGLDRPNVQDGARDLARGLIKLVDGGDLPRTRLVITGLDPFGLHLGHTVLTEHIPVINEHLLRGFLTDVAANLGRTALEAEIAECMGTILRPDGAAADLAEVEEAVLEHIRTHWAPSADAP